jgi:hypothetical protein
MTASGTTERKPSTGAVAYSVFPFKKRREN